MEKSRSPFWVGQLRKFGRNGAKCNKALDGVEKCGWGGEEFNTDEIAVERAKRRGADVLDLGFGHRGLAVDHQLDGLNRLDRQWLLGFDERPAWAEVEDADRFTDVKGTPEGSEDFEPDSVTTVGSGSHHAVFSRHSATARHRPVSLTGLSERKCPANNSTSLRLS